VSLPVLTIVSMGKVIDIVEWRRGRLEAVAASRSSGIATLVASPAGSSPTVATAERDLDMLEQAIQRLHPLVSRAFGRGRRLEGKVETELLAIMGELTVGLVREATRRAERLAERLGTAGAGSKA
jgi:hypothetical protein